jgi:hypothetical protein
MMKKANQIVAKLLEADEPPPEHYMNSLPVRFDREQLRRVMQHEASAWCMDVPEDKQAFLAWMQTHADLFPDLQYAVDVITANDAWCFDSGEDIERFLNAINPQHADYAKSNFERFAAAIGAENAAQEASVLARFKRAVRGYIIWAHAGDEQGAGYDQADLARLRKAKTFEEAEAVLAQYETQPSFLSMVSQGYFV